MTSLSPATPGRFLESKTTIKGTPALNVYTDSRGMTRVTDRELNADKGFDVNPGIMGSVLFPPSSGAPNGTAIGAGTNVQFNIQPQFTGPIDQIWLEIVIRNTHATDAVTLVPAPFFMQTLTIGNPGSGDPSTVLTIYPEDFWFENMLRTQEELARIGAFDALGMDVATFQNATALAALTNHTYYLPLVPYTMLQDFVPKVVATAGNTCVVFNGNSLGIIQSGTGTPVLVSLNLRFAVARNVPYEAALARQVALRRPFDVNYLKPTLYPLGQVTLTEGTPTTLQLTSITDLVAYFFLVIRVNKTPTAAGWTTLLALGGAGAAEISSGATLDLKTSGGTSIISAGSGVPAGFMRSAFLNDVITGDDIPTGGIMATVIPVYTFSACSDMCSAAATLSAGSKVTGFYNFNDAMFKQPQITITPGAGALGGVPTLVNVDIYTYSYCNTIFTADGRSITGYPIS